MDDAPQTSATGGSGQPPTVGPFAAPAPDVLFASPCITVVTAVRDGVDVVRVVLVGDVDIRRSAVVREAAAVAVEPRRPLVVDCRELDFMDSSALALFALLIRSRQPVTVEAPSPHVRTLLSMTGLDQLVTTAGPTG